MHDKQPQKANAAAKKASLAPLKKDESSEAADISYTSLLNHVNETLLQEPLAAPVGQPLPASPDFKIPEISAAQTSSRRLRVFENIPDTLSNRSDSQISIQWLAMSLETIRLVMKERELKYASYYSI